jgi:hypothetical protein
LIFVVSKGYCFLYIRLQCFNVKKTPNPDSNHQKVNIPRSSQLKKNPFVPTKKSPDSLPEKKKNTLWRLVVAPWRGTSSSTSPDLTPPTRRRCPASVNRGDSDQTASNKWDGMDM